MEKEKDLLILWLAHSEITSMEEYVDVLISKEAPVHSRAALWSLGLTKTWFKRAERPGRVEYTVFLKCVPERRCLDCFNRRIPAEKTDEAEAAEKESEISPQTKEKGGGEQKEPEQKSDEDESFPEKDIEEMFSHVDSSFREEEKEEKTKEERLYLIRTILCALRKTADYQMLAKSGKVSKDSLDRVLCAVLTGVSFITGMEVAVLFKFMYLLCSNLNGVFFSPEGQKIAEEEFDKLLLFVQNVSAISKKKFVYLLDVISTLNQEQLAKFVGDITKGTVTISGLKSSLFSAYSKTSALEIEKCKKERPGCIPRIFTPKIIFKHQESAKSSESLEEENYRLKQNIEVLFGDMQHFNTCDLVAQLKRELEKSKEDAKKETERQDSK